MSICIVTYNNPSTLKQAIMSIEEQEYHNYELVVVDDGSTAPDAVQYLEELQLKVSRVRVGVGVGVRVRDRVRVRSLVGSSPY